MKISIFQSMAVTSPTLVETVLRCATFIHSFSFFHHQQSFGSFFVTVIVSFVVLLGKKCANERVSSGRWEELGI